MKIKEIIDFSNIMETYVRAVHRTKGHQGAKMGVRCSSGPKKGMWVSDPKECNKRKQIKKVIQGRKTMMAKGPLIHQKSKVTKRGSFSQIIKSINQRLSGHGKHLKVVGNKDIDVINKGK